MTIDVPEIVAVLIGQHDGEVFIPDTAVRLVQKSVIEVDRDEDRGGYIVRLRPTRIDGLGSGE